MCVNNPSPPHPFTQRAIYDAIRDIDIGHSEYKRQFDQWVAENRSLTGTPEYRTYVNSFNEWEKEVLKRRAILISQLPLSVADQSLRKSLETVNPMEFLMSMMTMNVKDNSFLKAVISTHNKVKQSNEMNQAMLANAQPVHEPEYNPNVPPLAFRLVGNKATP